VSILSEKSLHPILDKQLTKAWQQFSEQYPEIMHQLVKQLSAQKLADFKLLFTLSDFALRSALQAPELVADLFISGNIYQLVLPEYQLLLNKQLGDCESEEQLHRLLRRFRLQQMVKIAFADLVLDISLDQSLLRQSNLADALILSALDWLSQFCYQKWGTPVNSDGKVQPLLVYGMGKLGGKELNFSSDIDLIFVYPEIGETQGHRRSIDNQQFFTRLGQKLITALNQQTHDGFVYRVDMRLRPFGESGPLVLTFNAMEDYYQEQGRDWERYAMLKARLIGKGDYHGQLSTLLRPFVYRRYIDFSVIESLRKMKMMISQEVRRKQLTNNIKLGAGGIREVEFIVQVFQLIRGGRIKSLQQRSLLTVLPLLVESGEIGAENRATLENGYRALRRIENIIQALDDQQTQTLPDNSLDQQRILHVLANDKITSWQAFIDYVNNVMASVHHEFHQLIGEENPSRQQQDNQWQILWDSDWSDEEAIEWISQVEPGWQAKSVWLLLCDFRLELTKRSIGSRGRQVLGKLLPLLLSHLAGIKVNEVTVGRILTVINKIMTRTAYLELLYENEAALIHLIKLCQASSWIAQHVAKFPILLDELIDPTLFQNPPALSSYAAEIRLAMLRIPEDDLEAQMDTLRQFKQAQHLRIAVADVVGVLPITKVSDHLTALAQAIIGEVVNLSWQQISLRFGLPSSLAGSDDKKFAVIGYGKMGGVELGYSSDLDLVFVHDCPLDDVTDGRKSIPISQFYAKLAQRIMHIFNTRMASGMLFDLDLRLRPSGNSGVLVVHIDTFAQYQKKEAWTWEHQALVRARGIYGEAEVLAKFSQIREDILSVEREQKSLQQNVIDMREKMRKHLDKSASDSYDIKQGAGGLVDIEFLAQYLVLNYSEQYHEITLYSDNLSLFNMLEKFNVITDKEKNLLISHYCRLRDHGHRSSLQHNVSTELDSDMREQATQVSAIYNKYLSI